ncbi:MAG: squalene synthase HpnC [Gemmatales bacterium]|nr:MAG: squalene synthase HpnC [Gemmatales bacterium]
MNDGFAAELKRYGPGTDYPPLDRNVAQSYCSRLARSHYENFSVASLLLPRRLVPHFHNVYAYCRWADDLADLPAAAAALNYRPLELLRWWRQELLSCYHGKPRHPVMIALSRTIRQFGIPAQPFLDLLFAFEQDQLIRQYRTYEQLIGYCQHSANPVGRIVLYLFGQFNATNATYADAICTALQLTNFWQDVRRDLDLGRVYLPEEDRLRFGYSDEDLHARRFTPAFAQLMQFEIERTRALFQQGSALFARLPEAARMNVELFADGGLAILRKIETLGYNVWRKRPVLPRWQKGWLVLNSLFRRWRRHVEQNWTTHQTTSDA